MNFLVNCLMFLASAGLIKLYCFLAQDTRLMDQPNERSLHYTPKIRGGGIVFIGLPLLIIPYICYVTHTPFSAFAVFSLSVLLLAGVSFLDDLYGLSVKPRFLVQAGVALLVAVFMRPEHLDFLLFSLSQPMVIIPMIFLTVMWSINHFNFMDGLDGICAMQALFLFIAYALLFSFNQAPVYENVCNLFIFSLLGFLFFNFPPAKLFMGDVGSASLGLIVFCIALIAQSHYDIPIIYWFMLNGLFLFDATLTLLRRLLNQEKVSQAHNKHAYQRLKRLGLDTRLILLGQGLLNEFILILVLMVYFKSMPIIVILGLEMLSLGYIYYLVERKFPMHAQNI